MDYKILSSKNRDEWLEQRKQYVTATDIVKIRTGSDKAIASLWREKHQPGRQFSGNKYTEWGNEREPVIAGIVSRDFNTTMKPNDQLCVSTVHDGLAATPDMIGANNSTCQIKTVCADKNWGSISDLPRDYRFQVEAEMLVMGTDQCLFAWETYTEGVFGFKPGNVTVQTYHSDPKLRAKVLEVLAKFQAYEPADITELTDFEALALVDEISEKQAELSVAKKQVKTLEAVIAGASARLIELLGDSTRSYRNEGILVEVTPPGESNRFNRAGLIADYPEIAEKYTVKGSIPAKVKVSGK